MRPGSETAAGGHPLRLRLQVDQLAFRQGALHCDCPAVVAALPFSGPASPASSRRPSCPLVAEAEAAHSPPQRLEEAGAEPRGAGDLTDEQVLSQMLCYVREFLAKPHPALGATTFSSASPRWLDG